MTRISVEAARLFVRTWTGRGTERGESQLFWYQLLHDVFGVEVPADFIRFELPVHLKNSKFIDAYIPSTKVLIEQKSSTEDLTKPKRQSDNTQLTPYEQALRYSVGLPYSERPRWIVTSNFKSFLIYDMEKPAGEPFEILLENLERECYLLRFLVEDVDRALRHEQEISIKAGELVGRLYDEFHKGYIHPDAPATLYSLNVLCVRLVFCLFAEDSGLFGEKRGAFHDYLMSFKPSQMRKALLDLFNILNTPVESRDPYENEVLLTFPYVNGGLFSESDVEIPAFTDAIADLLLEECSSRFDWSGISPTIFGALFEDTMNPDTRERGCMHYTSVGNIHRVIDPLFMNDLDSEFRSILQIKAPKVRRSRLLAFQDKLASLSFLDPACGSGNFLTETYLSLRHLENEVLEVVCNGDRSLGGELSPIKVSIDHFYGMEINDFAVKVAKAALWIAEAQMMRKTEHIVMRDLEFLPLRSYSHVEKLDALSNDWKRFVNPAEISYIIGNPPFKGKKSRDENQKKDLLTAIGNDSPRPGNMDLVSGWFLKAARYIQDTTIKVSFVSTINITRGEQVSLLWEALLQKYHIKIHFAYLPFVWNSESMKKAQVHCTIIGFGIEEPALRLLYSGNNIPKVVKRISPYLREEETTIVSSRSAPVCRVPKAGIGNKPIDGGYFMFTPEEKEEFIAREPLSEKYFMEWYGAEELIKGKMRYFLWLADCPPSELRRMPLCKQRIESVRDYRSKSKDAGTRSLASFPTRFHVTNIPVTDFIVIPEVSSENRQYIPMEYVPNGASAGKLFSNLVKLLPDATYYHFGVLQSSVHIAWVRGICGYKDFRPRYSTDVVYNNFPWPLSLSEDAKLRIEASAKAIIAARHNHPGCSLGDLYDVDAMPDDLRQAHKINDSAVLAAYSFTDSMSDDEMVERLLGMYKKATDGR